MNVPLNPPELQVIVDECGCTTESSVALLMRMDPKVGIARACDPMI